VPESSRLEREYFDRDTLTVARDLLGTRLVRIEGERRLSGAIVETEAYRGMEDQGSHARVGITPRTRIMYGPPGHAYVYFTYGHHWMLNFVTEEQGFPAAVLIRAILPEEGIEVIATRRDPQPPQRWTDGPGKLCQALGITGELNGIDLCSPDSPLFVETGSPIPDASVTTGPRVGLYTVPEPWKSIPWRFRTKME
jgi:DNA-3-methyladenine glycosylase